MIKASIQIGLKKGVLDTQGKAVEELIKDLAVQGISNVRIGKWVELTFANKENINEQVEALCQKVLVNPEMEDYSYTLEECESE
ncbi:phosphoribosylformylglycinamidine synthase subunit PurS [Amphibacillus sp. Q70]|uniref:phosphoribosylformylglycinamidine synthase subunit PurS n=1 Tax=Amphibacillus sp. Q70 TaxID=3453416 RepID=UPI003F865E58